MSKFKLAAGLPMGGPEVLVGGWAWARFCLSPLAALEKTAGNYGLRANKLALGENPARLALRFRTEKQASRGNLGLTVAGFVVGALLAAELMGGCGQEAPSPTASALLAATLDQAFVPSDATVQGEWALEGSDGAALDVTALLGAWSLVGVGYTSCPDVCPATFTAMPALVDQITQRLPPGVDLQVLFVAVDPARDRDGLEAYRGHFADGMGARLLAATGSPEMLQRVAADVGLAFTVDGTDVQHSTAWALVSPSGRVEGYLLHPTDAERCVDGVGGVLGDERWVDTPPVRVEGPWLRPPPPGGRIGAAYGRLVNTTERPKRLVSASLADGSAVAVHETFVENGIAGMRPAAVSVPAHGEARLEPMGAHLMVDPAADRDHVDVRLAFDDGTAAWARFAAAQR